jgi:hypothetical protein
MMHALDSSAHIPLDGDATNATQASTSRPSVLTTDRGEPTSG